MATTAKDVESAKKTAEAVWVVEHATRCPDGGCGVAGCVGASCVGTSSVSGVLTRWVGWRIVAGAGGWDSC